MTHAILGPFGVVLLLGLRCVPFAFLATSAALGARENRATGTVVVLRAAMVMRFSLTGCPATMTSIATRTAWGPTSEIVT